jgi:hypothetical protein
VKWTFAALAAVLLLSGCSKNIDNKEAVRKGVIDYLTKRSGQTGLDMKMMDVSVTDVRFDKNEATATVAFKPKGGAEGMSMNYSLERRGNEWVVKGRKESGMNPHGGQMPGGMMPGGAMPGAAMPPNHPPVETKKPSDTK